MQSLDTPRRRLPSLHIGEIARYTILISIAAVVLIPLVVAFLGGFRENQDLLRNPASLPDPFILSNYTDVLSRPSFWRQVMNSTVIMLLTTVIALSLASAVAFVLARMQFRGREPLFNFFTLGLLFPLPVAILPLYLLLRNMHLVDSIWGIILPQVAFGLPWNVLLLRSFFLAVPRDLEDAAYVDGAGPFEFLIRILLPLVRPALAAVAVLTMVTSWNNFFLPLVVLNREELWTMPLGVTQFQGQYLTDWARVLAFVTLALVPAVGFYLVAERQLIAGLTAGSVKG